MRDKALKVIEDNNLTEFLIFRGMTNRVVKCMIDFATQETEALQTKLNNERKMNESHVNTLLKQIEDKNKTNL
jgi:hypothetical protein